MVAWAGVALLALFVVIAGVGSGFGAAAFLAVAGAIPIVQTLRVGAVMTPEGVTVRTPFRSWRVAWSDVADVVLSGPDHSVGELLARQRRMANCHLVRTDGLLIPVRACESIASFTPIPYLWSQSPETAQAKAMQLRDAWQAATQRA